MQRPSQESDGPEVEAINRSLALVLLTDGQTVPVVSWFRDGDDCDPMDAESCVCGPDADGKWLTVDLTMFHQARTQ